MKKKVLIIIAILIAAILLVPIPFRLKDGGSVEYKAILYTVKAVHQINPDIEQPYIEGTIIRILGVEVFNNTKPSQEKEQSNYNNKTNTSDLVLEEPPALTVMCGKESVEALRGTSSWQYLNDNGTSTAIESDSMHPLQAKEYMTPLKLIPTQYSSVEPFKAYLKWDVAPDWVAVRYWSEESWGEFNAESEMIPVLMMDSDTDIGPIFPMDLQKGNYIYEVTAEWNNYDKFSGKAHYSFYTANYYDIEFNDLEPIPQSE